MQCLTPTPHRHTTPPAAAGPGNAPRPAAPRQWCCPRHGRGRRRCRPARRRPCVAGSPVSGPGPPACRVAGAAGEESIADDGATVKPQADAARRPGVCTTCTWPPRVSTSPSVRSNRRRQRRRYRRMDAKRARCGLAYWSWACRRSGWAGQQHGLTNAGHGGQDALGSAALWIRKSMFMAHTHRRQCRSPLPADEHCRLCRSSRQRLYRRPWLLSWP